MVNIYSINLELWKIILKIGFSNSRGRGLFCAFDLDSPTSRDKLISNMEKEGALILGCGA